jgi:hypothetical protein
MSYGSEEATIDSRRRQEQRRQEFLDHLARKHAARLGISLNIARQRVDAVAVTARKRDDVEVES